MKEEATSHATVNTVFIVHLILVVIAWTGPFIFPWYLMVLGYAVVVGQFLYYKRCLMNEAHGLDDSGDHTFYSHLFEKMGFSPNRKKLKDFVRGYLYVILAIFTLILQLGMGYNAWLTT